MKRAHMLWNLFQTFFRIGLFTFGGGYAMLPLISHACVEKKNWITHEEMEQVTAIAESTPGPIAVNCATFVGMKQAGIPGSVVATLGVILPSFIIILIIANLLPRFSEYPTVVNAFRGIKLAVGALILNAGVNMAKKLPKKAFPRVVCVIAATVTAALEIFSLHVSTVFLMLAAAAAGLIAYAVTAAKKRKGGETQ